ncbi:MAG: glucose-6-phosphate isomerase [Planctomycetota bacterium]|jgi:glucose-6-phosphate isomerase|nr:glucose-6-phosphate isomerase [Planctomycetota bacterium]MDP6762102.1 glucose-6-phosphate isomerase [Planctomycetota bacterium]
MESVQLDYTCALADAVGPEHGITEADLDALAAPSAAALRGVLARRERDLCWLGLPDAHEVRGRIGEYAASVAGRFQNVVVLGIGGSALGNTALFTALQGPFHNLCPPDGLPRLFVLDNVDPDLIGEWMERFDPSRTLFNVISKSGGTAETMSQFLIFRDLLVERLGEEGHREHVVITTDAEKGVLREVVEREGYASFVVPEGVGGRFSVLSPVGLLSSALVGVDIESLAAGAAAMARRCESERLGENPALVYAALQWWMQARANKPISVTFAYSHRLRNLGDWYAQLLAESIGKRVSRGGQECFAGPTPVRAVGVTDQHSQVQLYVEGPHDKWFTLLCVERPHREVTIPAVPAGLEALDYLGGRGLGELFAAERDGTRVALREASRPSVSVLFPTVDAHSVGQYLFLMELAVAVMGEHYDVDAFDQPGVEAGKVAAYALMGREGYEERRAAIEAAGSGAPRRV